MSKYALLSVSDKTNILLIAKHLVNSGYNILSSSGTYKYLEDNNIENIHKISDYTQFPEILNGRVKTLHPKIYGSILADKNNTKHMEDILSNDCKLIDIVIVNLYPFDKIINSNHIEEDVIENIDIGGHTLIRASAKNYKNILIIVSPNDYDNIINTWDSIDINFRKEMAKKAFHHIAKYDISISSYYNTDYYYRIYSKITSLRYGCNPHQIDSFICSLHDKNFPLQVLNGAPSYINFLDAVGSWQLVNDLQNITGYISAASFKHTAPAGVGICKKLDDILTIIYDVEKYDMTDTANAYIRARNSDPMSSFGDFIAISSQVDAVTAKLIKREISDGIIAPSYTDEALKILKTKKSGKFLIMQINPKYINNNLLEFREIFGMVLLQKPNKILTNSDMFTNIPTENKNLPEDMVLNLIIANTSLKYTPSNSVAYSVDGQIIGIGAGQQNRIDCVKLAGDKCKKWILRQHPKVLNLLKNFRKGIRRQAKINCIIQYINNTFTDIEYNLWKSNFRDEYIFKPLSDEDKKSFLQDNLQNVCLSSDGFFPFRDNIDEAHKNGVKYIIQPGGSILDKNIISACNDYNITMVLSGKRLFYH